MRMDREPKNRTRNLFAMANLAMAAIICLVPCHDTASATVFEDGQCWIGGYMADPLDIQPSVDSGQLEIAGNIWTYTGQSFPDDTPFTNIMTIGSIAPMGNGYYHIQGTQGGSEAFDVTVAATPTLICEVDPAYDGGSLGMTIVMPKAESPVAANFDGHWTHFSLDSNQISAEVQITDVELNATLGTGTHQSPGEAPFPFTWSLDPAASTVTVDLGDVSFDIGAGNGGLMFHAGLGIGESEHDELSMDLFVKTGSGRDEQEAVGRYAVQSLVSDGGLSQWNTYKGILSVNADGAYHVDFDPDAMGGEPDGWSDDGTWSMDATGRISFQSQEGGSPLSGHLSLTGDVIVAAEPAGDPGDNFSLIIATHVVPEPSVLLMLISAGLVLLFVRRELKLR